MEKTYRNGREWFDELPELLPHDPIISAKRLKGLWIPDRYLHNSDLTYAEKFLMGYIYILDQDSHCYASNKYLADLMGLSESRLSNMLVSLKKKKCIKQISWDGKIRKLTCI